LVAPSKEEEEAFLLELLSKLAGSEDALFDDVLRLTQLLLLLELAARLLDRELKPLVDVAFVAPSSESERSSWRADASPKVAEERRKGRSLPPEKTSSAAHMSAASSPASAGPPDESTQNSKSSVPGEASFSTISFPAADRRVGAAPVGLGTDGFSRPWFEGGTEQAIAVSCLRTREAEERRGEEALRVLLLLH
jgi:hypothetical protein